MSSSNNTNTTTTTLSSIVTDFGDRFDVFKFLGQGAGGPVSAAFDKQHPDYKSTDPKIKRKSVVALKRISKGDAEQEFSILVHMHNQQNVIRAFELVEPDHHHRNNNSSNKHHRKESSTSLTSQQIAGGNTNNNNSQQQQPANIMVMEFANLGSASKIAVLLGKKNRTIPVNQREWFAKKVTRDVLKALQYLHKNNVVHRDVKASNCLLFDESLVVDQQQQQEVASSETTTSSKETNNNSKKATIDLLLRNHASPVDSIFPPSSSSASEENSSPSTSPSFLAKLSDFGLAKRVQETNPQILLSSRKNAQTAHSDEIAGSVYWLSPESLQGLVAPCADIWALGCLAYELINSGRPPLNDREWANAMYVVLSCQDRKESSLIPTLMKFARDRRDSIMKNRVGHNQDDDGEEADEETNQYEFLEQISPSCLDFLARALTIDPTRRPSAEDLLDHDWIKTISKRPPPPAINISSQQQQNQNQKQQQPQTKPPPLPDQSSYHSFALERLVSACSQGITFANRSWLWLPKSSSHHNNSSALSSAPASPANQTFSLTTENNQFDGYNNNNSNSLNNTLGASGTVNNPHQQQPITDITQLTPFQRSQIKERVREMIERLRTTSELVRDSVAAAVSAFAEQKSFGSSLTNFETWFDIVPPSTDVMAMTMAHLQTYHENSDACQQAIVLISRVVWVLATLFFESGNENQMMTNQQLLNNNNNNNNNVLNFIGNANGAAASSSASLSDFEAQLTRSNLIVDLAECGFWTSSKGLDWTMLFPSVVSITRTNPQTFKEVEGRSRYTELCRDTARGLFKLFEASCYHSDIRCLKACVRSPHTIRFLLSHECTRRETALCFSQAMSRLGEVMIVPQQSRSSSRKNNNKLRRSNSSSANHNSSSGRTNPQQHGVGKNNSNNKYSDADNLFSPERVAQQQQQSAGGPVAGAVQQQQHKRNNSTASALRRSGSGVFSTNNDPMSSLGGGGGHNDNARNNLSSSGTLTSNPNNNNGNSNNSSSSTSFFSSVSTATGPQEIILTAQALRSLLPHFIDEAALAVASDASSEPDHITFDIVCDAFLRVTVGSDDMFVQFVSSTVFMRKLSMGLPPNRIANHAVAILTRFAATIRSIDDLLRLVPLATWLSLASNTMISYARCSEVIEIIARLRLDAKIAEILVKEIPVISYALNRPIDSSSYFNNNEAPARLMNAVKLLCTDPAIGTSYASSSAIREGVMSRFREAAKYRKYNEVVSAIELLGVLFTFSSNPDVFTNSDELLRLLLKFVKAPLNPMNRDAIKHASRFFNTICAVASF